MKMGICELILCDSCQVYSNPVLYARLYVFPQMSLDVNVYYHYELNIIKII